MAKKKFPPNYSSWIDFHKYVLSLYPNIKPKQMIVIRTVENVKPYLGDTITTETYRIQYGVLQRLCWEEIQDSIPNEKDLVTLKHAMYECNHTMGNTEYYKRINAFVDRFLQFRNILNYDIMRKN